MSLDARRRWHCHSLGHVCAVGAGRCTPVCAKVRRIRSCIRVRYRLTAAVFVLRSWHMRSRIDVSVLWARLKRCIVSLLFDVLLDTVLFGKMRALTNVVSHTIRSMSIYIGLSCCVCAVLEGIAKSCRVVVQSIVAAIRLICGQEVRSAICRT
jgi:hypothetical protein